MAGDSLDSGKREAGAIPMSRIEWTCFRRRQQRRQPLCPICAALLNQGSGWGHRDRAFLNCASGVYKYAHE
jgi:hypothetical protein